MKPRGRDSILTKGTGGGISAERIAAFFPLLRDRSEVELRAIAEDSSKSAAIRHCARYLLGEGAPDLGAERERALADLRSMAGRRGLTMVKLSELYGKASKSEHMVIEKKRKVTRYQSPSHPGGTVYTTWTAFIYRKPGTEYLVDRHAVGHKAWRVQDLLRHCLGRLLRERQEESEIAAAACASRVDA